MRRFFEGLHAVGSRSGERPENRYFRLALYVLIAAIILTLVIGATTFLISLRGGDKTMVPDIEGMPLEQAAVSLQERDLYPFVRLRHFSDPSLKGKVVEQDPAPGTQVRESKRVTLVVSKGAVVDRVGDYVGRSLEEVRTELQTLFSTFEAVLKIDDVSYVYDESEPGTIVEQDPQPGTEISGVTELDLVVSRGPDVERIELPSYAGLSYEEAVELLAQKSIPFVFKLVEGSADQKSGVVLSQSPEPETEVPVGSKVTLEMIPPRSMPAGQVFGVFSRVLPDYPVAVELALELVTPGGERRTVFSMKHPGGDIAVPYSAPRGSRLILSRFDTEVITEPVQAMVKGPAAEESGGSGTSAQAGESGQSGGSGQSGAGSQSEASGQSSGTDQSGGSEETAED